MPNEAKSRQVGISPKILADLVLSILTFALLAYGVEIDKDTSAAIAKLVGFVAGYVVPPGTVTHSNVRNG